jgi:hypothetical protein
VTRGIQLAIATLFLIFIAPVAPAHAGNMHLTHAQDDGYNPPIATKCTNGISAFLHVGESTTTYCARTHQVYVNAGAKLVCYYSGIGWTTWKTTTGWHDAGGSNQWCVYQLD